MVSGFAPTVEFNISHTWRKSFKKRNNAVHVIRINALASNVFMNYHNTPHTYSCFSTKESNAVGIFEASGVNKHF